MQYLIDYYLVNESDTNPKYPLMINLPTVYKLETSDYCDYDYLHTCQ